MSASRRRLAAAAGLCIVLGLWAVWALREQQLDRQRHARGAALFRGELPLVARLTGHAQALPAAAVRCSNCHEALERAPSTAAPAAIGAPRPYAGVIQGSALTTPRPRRGGPPSVYDAARLCELLRTGVDPAQVIIPVTMPRYDVTPADCADLWVYLRHEPD